jgi:hypothetical protein
MTSLPTTEFPTVKKPRKRRKNHATRNTTRDLPLLLVGAGNLVINAARFVWSFFHHHAS